MYSPIRWSVDVRVDMLPRYGQMNSLSRRSLLVNRPLCAWLMQDSPIPTPCVCVFFRWYSRWSDLYVSMCSSVSMLYVGLFSVHVLVSLGLSASVALLVLHSWLF